jgi:hypothetical protein
MRLNIFTLIWLLLAGCAQSPVRPDVAVVDALAAVRGDGPRVVRGADSVRAHLLAQKQLSETRAQRLRRWCEGAEVSESPMAELHCPGPDGTIQLLATPVMPADVVERSHEPGIDGGDWVARVGDYLLIADQGSLSSIDVAGPEGAPLRIADRMSYDPATADDRRALRDSHQGTAAYSRWRRATRQSSGRPGQCRRDRTRRHQSRPRSGCRRRRRRSR